MKRSFLITILLSATFLSCFSQEDSINYDLVNAHLKKYPNLHPDDSIFILRPFTIAKRHNQETLDQIAYIKKSYKQQEGKWWAFYRKKTDGITDQYFAGVGNKIYDQQSVLFYSKGIESSWDYRDSSLRITKNREYFGDDWEGYSESVNCYYDKNGIFFALITRDHVNNVMSMGNPLQKPNGEFSREEYRIYFDQDQNCIQLLKKECAGPKALKDSIISHAPNIEIECALSDSLLQENWDLLEKYVFKEEQPFTIPRYKKKNDFQTAEATEQQNITTKK